MNHHILCGAWIILSQNAYVFLTTNIHVKAHNTDRRREKKCVRIETTQFGSVAVTKQRVGNAVRTGTQGAATLLVVFYFLGHITDETNVCCFFFMILMPCACVCARVCACVYVYVHACMCVSAHVCLCV